MVSGIIETIMFLLCTVLWATNAYITKDKIVKVINIILSVSLGILTIKNIMELIMNIIIIA